MNPAEKPLTFDWPGGHHLHITLPLTIIFAALLHAGMFYLFSVDYPHSTVESLEPAQVYFVPKETEEFAQLATILNAADPALFAPGRGLARRESGVSSINYTPQYDAQKAAFDPLPPITWKSQENPMPYGAVPSPNHHRKPIQKPSILRTQLHSGGVLAKRLPEIPDSALFETPFRQNLEPAVFFVGIRPNGAVAYIVLQHSSGSAPLDETALKLLKTLSFAPAEGGDAWGFVSFQWGADVQFVEVP